MKKFFGLLGKGILIVVTVLAALSNIGLYMEQGQIPSQMVQMLSPYISLGFLSLVFQLLFLCAVAASFWWLISMEEKVRELEDVKKLALREVEAIKSLSERLRKLEGSKAPLIEPKFNEIIYPSPVGVLWALDIDKNAVGDPLCPRHRDRLLYKHAVGGTEGKDIGNRWLSGGWLFCPTDGEEFKIMERTVQVKKLQDEVDTILRSRIGRNI